MDYKKVREFEDKIGFEILIETNKKIGIYLGFEPEIEYAVSANGGCCYSPKNVGNYFTNWQSQKAECERWLKEQKERFPDGWVIQQGYEPKKYEYYPNFHTDWNFLIEAINRLFEKGSPVDINHHDIFHTWGVVAKNCH